MEWSEKEHKNGAAAAATTTQINKCDVWQMNKTSVHHTRRIRKQKSIWLRLDFVHIRGL